MSFFTNIDDSRLSLFTVLMALMINFSGFVSNGKQMEGEAEKTASGKEMKSIKVAGVKMDVTNNIEANAVEIKKAIDYARNEKADILLTPEGSLSGYTANFDKENANKALADVVAYASKAKVGLALGTCFYENDKKCYDQLRFYDSDGNYIGAHSKILLCGDLYDFAKGEINDYSTTPLQTFVFKGIIIGGLICNDMWANPGFTTLPDTHLYLQLSKMGAKIIFHAVNGGRSESEWSDIFWNYHESNLRIRAKFGNIWIVTTDNSYPANLRSSSPAGVLNPEGKWVCSSGAKGVQYFSYTIEIQP